LKKLTIYRDQWARGRRRNEYGKLTNVLLGGDKQRCCLGFLGRMCGYEDQILRYGSTPAGLLDQIPDLENLWGPEVLRKADEQQGPSHTAWTREAVYINDDPSITEPQREAWMIAHFARIGIELTLQDKEETT
jgi:hypothetical protein